MRFQLISVRRSISAARHPSMRRYCCGTAMAEFAVTIVLFFLFSLGIVETARAIGIYEEITNAAREGTRYAVVHGPNSLSPATSADVQNYVMSKTAGLNASSLTVNVSWPQDPSDPNLTDVIVQVSYPYSPIIPFMQQVSLNFTTQSKMVIWPKGGSSTIIQ